MTGVKKGFVLLVVEIALLGAAFGGGTYMQLKKKQAALAEREEAKKAAAQSAEAALKTLSSARARSQLLEAAISVVYQNYSLAFDRVVRTQSLMQRIGLVLDKELDEVSALLVQQKPEVVFKLLALAEKIDPSPGFSLPKTLKSGSQLKAVPAEDKPGAAAAGGPATILPQSDKTSVGASATITAKESSKDLANSDGNADFQAGREALRQAKELLLAGGDYREIVKKLARAQVLLDDSGYKDIDDELGAAIKAAKDHDETRVRAALEAGLFRLRGR